jgi:cystathionine beta-lyase/cystathionine gamma-synthase
MRVSRLRRTLRLSCGIEDVEDLRGGLEGLEDKNSG